MENVTLLDVLSVIYYTLYGGDTRKKSQIKNNLVSIQPQIELWSNERFSTSQSFSRPPVHPYRNTGLIIPVSHNQSNLKWHLNAIRRIKLHNAVYIFCATVARFQDQLTILGFTIQINHVARTADLQAAPRTAGENRDLIWRAHLVQFLYPGRGTRCKFTCSWTSAKLENGRATEKFGTCCHSSIVFRTWREDVGFAGLC